MTRVTFGRCNHEPLRIDMPLHSIRNHFATRNHITSTGIDRRAMNTDTPMVDALIAKDVADPTANIGRRIRHMIALAVALERDRAALIAVLERLAVRDFEVMDAADCEWLRASIRAYLVQS
jgi:hypothetical protein